MSSELSGKRVAFLVANAGVKQVELTKPWAAVEAAGGVPVLIAPDKEPVQAVHHDFELGDSFDPSTLPVTWSQPTSTRWYCRVVSPIPISSGLSRKP